MEEAEECVYKQVSRVPDGMVIKEGFENFSSSVHEHKHKYNINYDTHHVQLEDGVVAQHIIEMVTRQNKCVDLMTQKYADYATLKKLVLSSTELQVVETCPLVHENTVIVPINRTHLTDATPILNLSMLFMKPEKIRAFLTQHKYKFVAIPGSEIMAPVLLPDVLGCFDAAFAAWYYEILPQWQCPQHSLPAIRRKIERARSRIIEQRNNNREFYYRKNKIPYAPFHLRFNFRAARRRHNAKSRKHPLLSPVTSVRT